MGQRLDFHNILLALMPENAKNVYFQQPENLKMQYPCIVYQRDYSIVQHADNKPYIHKKRYQVTVIDEDPDSEIPDAVIELPLSSFQRFFIADDLNHYINNVYF